MKNYLDTWAIDRHDHRLTKRQRITRWLRSKLRRQAPTLISGMDPTTLAAGIDISHWQGDVDIARMARDGKIAWCSPKACDGKQVVKGDPTVPANYVDDWLYRNVQKCYDAKIACLPYHYLLLAAPDYTVSGLIDWNWRVIEEAFRSLVPGVSYQGFVLDFEEMNATPTNGSDILREIINRVQDHPKLNKVPWFVYTSMSVLNRYWPIRDELSQRGKDTNWWMAQWSYNTVTTTTWEQFWSYYVPRIDMKVLLPGYAPGFKMLQWSSSFILPGCAGRTDVNFASMTKANFYNFLKFQSGEIPPVDPPPTGDFVKVADFNVWKAEVYAKHTHEMTVPLND